MPKNKYRVRNWNEYNRSLVQRGSITLWVSEEALHNWQSPGSFGKRGRLESFSNGFILCALSLKSIYSLTFRGVEGFLESLLKLLKVNVKAPHYS